MDLNLWFWMIWLQHVCIFTYQAYISLRNVMGLSGLFVFFVYTFICVQSRSHFPKYPTVHFSLNLYVSQTSVLIQSPVIPLQDCSRQCWTWRPWPTYPLMLPVASWAQRCSVSWWNMYRACLLETHSVGSATRGVQTQSVRTCSSFIGKTITPINHARLVHECQIGQMLTNHFVEKDNCRMKWGINRNMTRWQYKNYPAMIIQTAG